jgi:O-antigen ligase
LAAFLLKPRQKRLKYGVGFSIALSAMLISLARSVLIAFPVVALVVVWIALRKGTLKLRRLVPLAVGIGLLLLIISPIIVNSIAERFSSIDPTELLSDPTSMTRILQTYVAVQNIQAHPIFGTGTASFQLLFNWDDYIPGMQGDQTVAGWVGNTPLRILHDTGIVGLAAFLMFIGGLALEARKAMAKVDGDMRAMLVALVAGTMLYAITFQATEATMLAFTWVHLGLLAAAVQWVRDGNDSRRLAGR